MDVLRSTATLLYQLVSLRTNAFLTHAILEIPPSLNFFFNPSGQLVVYSPHAHPIIRQYAVLLACTSVIASSFVFREPDELSGQVAGGMALYHLAPLVRSTGRLASGEKSWQPVLFLIVHGICLAGLFGHSWEFYLSKMFTR